MKLKTFERMRRICALIGVVILVGMYVATLIASLMKSELAHSMFLFSLYCSIAVPVIIYMMQMIYKLANRKAESVEKDSEAEKTAK